MTAELLRLGNAKNARQPPRTFGNDSSIAKRMAKHDPALPFGHRRPSSSQRQRGTQSGAPGLGRDITGNQGEYVRRLVGSCFGIGAEIPHGCRDRTSVRQTRALRSGKTGTKQFQPLAWIGSRCIDPVKHVLRVLRKPGGDGQRQIGLRLEVIVEIADRQPCLSGNIGKACTMIAALPEQPRRC